MPTPNDVVVHFLIRFIKADRMPGNRCFMQQKYPQLYAVYNIGTGSKSALIRCTLQAAIISIQSDQQILKKLQWITPIQLRFYKDAFFDIQDIRKHKQWMQQFIINPVKNYSTRFLFRARKLAMQSGFDTALKACLWGQGGSVCKDAMKKLYINQRAKVLFDYCVVQHKVDQVTMAGIVSTTLNKMQDRQLQRQLHTDTSTVQDTNIAALSAGIQKHIRTYTIKQRQQASTDAADDSKNVIYKLIEQSEAKENE